MYFRSFNLYNVFVIIADAATFCEIDISMEFSVLALACMLRKVWKIYIHVCSLINLLLIGFN